MSINQTLLFISTVIMLGFTIYVFQRYFVRRAPHFLFWGIGLAMFGAGSFAEGYLSLAWSRKRRHSRLSPPLIKSPRNYR